MKTIVPILSFTVFIASPLIGGWLERKAEGWAWYEDIQKENPPIPKIEDPLLEIPHASDPPSFTATEKAAQIRQNLEEKLAKAVLEPTEQNIEDYMREQMKWINQSARFSTLWTKVLLQHPDLDATTEFPVSQYGIQLHKEIQQEERYALMQTLIPRYGLFFFYEGRSKSSQAFSLVVQEFAKKYGWEVIAISKDGFQLEGFKDNHVDNGSIQRLGVEIFPSLFLVDPHQADIRPIAFGLVSIDRIESNIALQFQQNTEE